MGKVVCQQFCFPFNLFYDVATMAIIYKSNQPNLAGRKVKNLRILCVRCLLSFSSEQQVFKVLPDFCVREGPSRGLLILTLHIRSGSEVKPFRTEVRTKQCICMYATSTYKRHLHFFRLWSLMAMSNLVNVKCELEGLHILRKIFIMSSNTKGKIGIFTSQNLKIFCCKFNEYFKKSPDINK